ncbi:MAG: hypothetical protein E7585_04835 [Ruminococcaceae bacterium]|nr:hypothetical protein [Oscillospiraceae bacterium]
MLYRDGIHDDTLALQALLDACGIIMLDRPGTYLVSKTLIIHSNTRLVMAPGVKLLAAPMSRCALIENEHFAGGGRDHDIEIVGGIFDGNCDAMGLDAVYEAKHRLDDPYSPALFKGKLMRFAHIDRIVLEKLTVKDPVSYGIQIGDVRGFVTRDLFFDYNHHFGTTDGVHINGPARDGVIENLCGTTNDDMVALTTYDEPHAEVSIGDIENVYIHNITAKNGYSGIRLLSGEDCSMCHVRVDGLYGDYRHNGIVISNHNSRPGKVWFDGIVLENIRARKSYTPLGEDCFRYWEKNADKRAIIQFEGGARCGNVVIRDVYRHEEQGTDSALIKMSADTTVDRLVLENLHQTAAEGAALSFLEIDAEIGELVEK